MVSLLYGSVLAALLWSGLAPYDRLTWLLEVAPILIAFPLLWLTRHRMRLTPLLYVLIALHALVLIVGGHWSYARVPLGFQVQEWLALSRNPYDKLGHFAQGFVPAMVARELFVRLGVVTRQGWLAFLAVCVALAVSACYELIEWWSALALGQGADEFLGTQGDMWDTQSDMFLALIGAGVALALLTRLHDRHLATAAPARLGAPGPAAPEVA